MPKNNSHINLTIFLLFLTSSTIFNMKSPALWMAIGAILLLGGSVNAWGGLFNRFSPEMLANMGYGSHGGSYRPQSFLQV